MTFQIGLFGSDGMLLAGDTQGSSDEYYTTTQSKFLHNSNMDIVVAQSSFSDGMRTARRLVDGPWNGDRLDGERIANEVYKAGSEGVHVPLPQQPTTRLIVVLPGQRRMSLFQVCSDSVVSDHTTGKLFAGQTTYAMLFLEEYYKPFLPLSQLKKLAAFTVWLTGEMVPQFVHGLEMIEFCDGKAPKRIEASEITSLLEWSRAAYGQIGTIFTSAAGSTSQVSSR